MTFLPRLGVSLNVNDAELVNRAIAGDDRAFDALVDRHYARCLRFAWRQIGSRADAEEVVQDAFVRAYRALSGCAPERFGSWLTSIVVNRCRTHVAKRARQPVLEPLGEMHDAVDPPPVSGEDLTGTDVGRALATLSPLLREALLLRYVEQLTYEQIAAMTGAGVSAVKMRVRRAAGQLAKALEGWKP